MSELVFAAPALDDLRALALERRDVETATVVFGRDVEGTRGSRILVTAASAAPEDAYSERTAITAHLRPEFVFEAVSRAKREGLACCFVHSHPQDEGTPRFSRRDDEGEARLRAYLDRMLPDRPAAALVVSPGGLAARELGRGVEIEVVQVGDRIERWPESAEGVAEERFDRQVRAFGRVGQTVIGGLRVAIVGLGGTGSFTALQLAHLGVRDFLLIDGDEVTETSLNRLVGAGPADVGTPKVEVAARMIRAIAPSATVSCVVGDVVEDGNARQLTKADVIMICTDSHASRAVASQIAYHFLIPAIEMGVIISVRDGSVFDVSGRVLLLAPGRPCMSCLEFLDPEKVRLEMMTETERALDPYMPGAEEPQPSVVSLNGTMASLATTMFIGLVTGAPVDARMQRYDAKRGTVRLMVADAQPGCYVCAQGMGVGRGDTWPLATRRRAEPSA